MPVVPEMDHYHNSDGGDTSDAPLHDGLEHSLHFGHVQQTNPYALSAIQPDLSYAYGTSDPPMLPSAYPLPDPALLSAPRKTERRRPPGKKNSDQPHIPRPRNAFILFRSAFIEQKNGKEIASKQQNLSRIAALVWRSMSNADQDPWYKLAAEEKQAHYAANPGYTFQPTGRGEAPKRKTRKPATEPQVEEGSCKRLADLIISGVQGDDLVAAAKTEGVAPFQRPDRRRRPIVQDQEFDLENSIGQQQESPAFMGQVGVLPPGDSSDDEHVVSHYPPPSPSAFDYERAPSPKF